ncbi:MAG: DUF488 family protein [Planctomycetota bacterium]|nr:MAG: DUF488 family protein [Planctomycetota bacterium]
MSPAAPGPVPGVMRTRRVRDAPDPADGERVLITRLWPRGMTREKVAARWDKRLAPSRELLMAFKHAGLGWDDYVQRFQAEMRGPDARQAVAELAAQLRAGATVTLLCECRADAEGEAGIHCHRRLVRALVEAQSRKKKPPSS